MNMDKWKVVEHALGALQIQTEDGRHLMSTFYDNWANKVVDTHNELIDMRNKQIDKLTDKINQLLEEKGINVAD